MPPFVSRPLTWTYLIAMAAATLLATASPPEMDGFLAFITMGLIFGQLWLLATWAAVGHALRVVRGLGLLLGILLMAAVVSHLDRHLSMRHVNEQVGPIFIITAPAFSGALLMKIVLDWRGVGPTQRFHFQIKEVFAWMAIIAVASRLLSLGNFQLLERMDARLIIILTAGAAAGLIGAICHRAAIPILVKVVLSASVVAAVAGFLMLASISPKPRFAFGAIGGGIYLAMAFACRNCDERFFRRRPNEFGSNAIPLTLGKQE